MYTLITNHLCKTGVFSFLNLPLTWGRLVQKPSQGVAEPSKPRTQIMCKLSDIIHDLSDLEKELQYDVLSDCLKTNHQKRFQLFLMFSQHPAEDINLKSDS
jgi:hypothetical protein